MTKDQIQTYTFRITRANKTELIAILYEMGSVYISDALSYLDAGNNKGFRDNILHAKDVVKELSASANAQTPLGMRFINLYIFYNECLSKAYLDYDKEPAIHVLKMLGELKEAYDELSSKDNSGRVMRNAESIFTGLTYNKRLVSETVSDVTRDRGYLV